MRRMHRLAPLCLLGLFACSSPQVPPGQFALSFAPEQRQSPSESDSAEIARCAELWQQGEDSEAVSRLGALLSNKPGLAEGWLLLGQIRDARAHAALREGSDPRARVEGSELTRAESALLTAKKLAPELLSVDLALAELFERIGHLEAAHGAYARVLEKRAFDLEALLGAARCATELGWERSATLRLDALRGLRPHPIEALALETAVYRRLARSSEAVEQRTRFYDRLLRAWTEWSEREPQDARGPRGIAATLRLRVEEFGGSYDAELIARIDALFAEARKLAPLDAELLFETAEFAERTDRQPDAERLYRRAIDVDAEHVPSLLNLGSLLESSDRPSEARYFWRRALPLLRSSDERDELDKLIAKPR
jgi:Flp pilus assembly protein TadD